MSLKRASALAALATVVMCHAMLVTTRRETLLCTI